MENVNPIQQPDTGQGIDNLDYAYSQLERKDVHTFLTGNAGTGKSTLLKKFMAANEGKYVALAPTGIAAVNIGGMTIHNFFRFPARPVDFASIKRLDPIYDYDLIQIWDKIEYIIIDEISMVRSDIMDQMFNFCKKNFPTSGAFAGKKLIMVGDVDQLPPVVSSEEEKAMIQSRYRSEFFFSANCWKDQDYFSDPFKDPFEVVTLTKIWRQKDPLFINLLNSIKTQTATSLDIARLNNTCVKDGRVNINDGVMLCTTNEIARTVNDNAINQLEGESIKLQGDFKGEFKEKDCPVEPIIHLKAGCRVMTMRNGNSEDGAYFNGSLGTFVEIREMEMENPNWVPGAKETITVDCVIIQMDAGFEVNIPRYNFENVKFVYDETTDRIRHTVIGQFTQFPIKLAYAMTIHKSQGQTFDKVIIDLGKGAFAHGQVYVALSRCRSLEGITLRRPVSSRDLIYSPMIMEFNKNNKARV